MGGRRESAATSGKKVTYVCLCLRFIRYKFKSFCLSFTDLCSSLLHVVLMPSFSFLLPGRNSILGRRPQVLRPWSAAAAVYNSSLRPLLLRGQRSVWCDALWANGPVMSIIRVEYIWETINHGVFMELIQMKQLLRKIDSTRIYLNIHLSYLLN